MAAEDFVGFKAVSMTRSGIYAYLLADWRQRSRRLFFGRILGQGKCIHHFVKSSRVFIHQKQQFIFHCYYRQSLKN